jgi:twitching motility protein PilT
MLAGLRNGLVLFTGPSGCGKSSSMAALVHAINSTRADNIVTMEDPIEFLHEPIMASIIQRQVGAHTQGFASALHAALREDPDVIVVGELRDLETIQLALTAAETGHLVLATLHTNNAARSINRIIAAYPQNQQEQVRAMLADGLRAVLSQRLLPTQDQPGRVVAAELLLVNRAVQNLIRENKTLQLRTLIQTSASEGMVLLDQSLAVLVQTGRVSAQEALRYAEDPRRIPAAGG